MIYKTLHRKVTIEQHELHQNRRWIHMLQKDKQFLLHLWYPSCYSFNRPGDVTNEERTGMWYWNHWYWFIYIIKSIFALQQEIILKGGKVNLSHDKVKRGEGELVTWQNNTINLLRHYQCKTWTTLSRYKHSVLSTLKLFN
jgi:hypothetical protein